MLSLAFKRVDIAVKKSTVLLQGHVDAVMVGETMHVEAQQQGSVWISD